METLVLLFLLSLLTLSCVMSAFGRRPEGLQSIVSGTLGAVLGNQSQRAANRQNAQNVADQNALQRELFYQSRGQGGNAILPMYFGPFEQRLANETINSYDAANQFYGTPAERLARGQQIQGQFQPLFQQGNQVLNDLYGGQLQSRLTGEYAPVGQAVTNLARTQRQGIYQGLQQRLAALGAQSAQKGYVGTGSGAQNALLRTTIGANQQAAGAVAAGDLQNQLALQAIRDRVLQQQFGSLDQASNRAQQALALENLPANFLASTYQAQTRPFDFFRVGVGTPPQQQPLPYVQPNFSTGQALAGAGQQLGSAFLDSYLKSQQAGGYGAPSAINNASPSASQWWGAGGASPSWDEMLGDY